MGDTPRDRRIAIVLRGPPGAGKTPVAEALQRQFGRSAVFVRLDDGWVRGQGRFDGPDRYRDLRSPTAVLIVELGWGEPEPPLFPGATMHPAEWVAVLEEEGRHVHLFLLWTTLNRTLERKLGRMDVLYAALAHERYEPGGACSSPAFLSRLYGRFTETLVDTSGQPVSETAAQVLRAVGAVGT